MIYGVQILRVSFLLTGRPKRYCYPLTISDSVSRYLISCEALESAKTSLSFPVFEEAFKEYGLPQAIRTDNGVPFGCSHGLFGWSLLSVWWLRLGIKVERIRPGHPEENGRHERIHRTLKASSIKTFCPYHFPINPLKLLDFSFQKRI